MSTVVRVHHDATSRLAEIGLDPEILRRAVEAGEMAADTCTDHDPSGFRGYTLWGVCTRELRMGLTPRGWKRQNRQNLPLVVSPDGAIAITVATGDPNTGIEDATPHTKNPRGRVTLTAIGVNAVQLTFLDPVGQLRPEPGVEPVALTWILLFYRDRDIIRCELSLADAWDDDGRPCGWAERLILEPVGVVDRPTIQMEQEPEIDVEVERKSSEQGG